MVVVREFDPSEVMRMKALLGPDASPEQVTERMEQIAEDRRRRHLDIHTSCTSPGPPPVPANCIPPPVDIEAIYEYLSAIPCIDNTWSTPPAGTPNELRNDCGNGPPPPPK